MIDAGRVTFVEREEKRFIRYELSAEEKISRTELEMLKNTEIKNILKIAEIHEDGREIFLYNVTSKIPLSMWLKASFSGEQFYKVLKSFCRAWICADEYMLNREHFVLYPEVMYLTQETSELFIMVLPVCAEDDKELEFHKIVATICYSIHYDDEKMQGFFVRIQKYIGQYRQFTAKEFEEFLEQVYREEHGILQPLSEAPSAPENRQEEEKRRVDEEEVKKKLQDEFQENREEAKTLKNKELEKNILPSTGIPGLNSVPAIPGLPKKKKKEKEKEEKQAKKGFFHGLWKNKEKEAQEVKTEVDIQPPVNNVQNPQNLPYMQPPVNNMQNLPYTQPPVNNMQNPPYIQPPVNTGQGVFYWENIKQAEDRKIVPKPEIYTEWSLSAEKAQEGKEQNGSDHVHSANSPEQERTDFDVTMLTEEGIDLDDTMLIDDGIDLDATFLMNEPQSVSVPVLRSKETGEIIKITHSGFLIGRQQIKNEEVVDQNGNKRHSVSRSHALFIEKGGEWYVTDQESANGTFLNEERLLPNQESILKEGDILKFASKEYEYLVIKE